MVTNIHIERLVLDGISMPYHQRAIFQQALQDELARLLVDGGLSPDMLAGGAVDFVQGSAFILAPDALPVDLGRQVARSVYGGLGAGEPASGGKPNA